VACALVAGCAANPYDVSSGAAAHLIGQRAILHPEWRGKEHVYFTQIDRKDLRDRWGDYPADLYVPPGLRTLLVVCEWHSDYALGAIATHAEQIRQRFKVGHEYRFTSRPLGEGMCKTTMEDVTETQRRAEAEGKAAEETGDTVQAVANEENKASRKKANTRKRKR
jgi:hypothetical protein